MITLDQTAKGRGVRILEIRDPGLRKQALRLGLAENSQVRCLANLPGGPVVIGLGTQKIAVGRELAKEVIVK